MTRILVISLTDLKRDPRVRRQIEALRQARVVITARVDQPNYLLHFKGRLRHLSDGRKRRQPVIGVCLKRSSELSLPRGAEIFALHRSRQVGRQTLAPDTELSSRPTVAQATDP